MKLRAIAAALWCGLVALAAAGAAFGAFTPSVKVQSVIDAAENSSLAITYHQSSTDDPLGRLDVYFPAGYLYDFSDPAGTVIAGGKATVAGQSKTGRAVAATGTQALPSGQTLAAAAGACLAAGAAQSGFVVLDLGGGQLIPMFWSALSPSNPLSALYAYTLSFCPGSAGLTDLTLTFPNIVSFAEGRYLFRSAATPAAAGTTTLNGAGAVEIQSLTAAPGAITAAAKKGKDGSLTVVGKVTHGGGPVGGAPIQILSGGKSVAEGKSKPGGVFSITVPAGSGRLVATTKVADRTAGCTGTLLKLSACTGMTVAGFTARAPVAK